MRDEGCKLLLYPGCFNTTTGPAHWELLLRGRAVDNQLYVTFTCLPLFLPAVFRCLSSGACAAGTLRVCAVPGTQVFPDSSLFHNRLIFFPLSFL